MSAASPPPAATPPPAAPIRVALVEDDLHFQNEVVKSIRASAEAVLTGIAGSCAQALALLKQPAADVLLVDLGLPDGSGIEVIRAAQAAWPGCGIMVCTALGDEAHVMRALEAGASGYLLKDIGPENMMDEIRSLNAGGSPISPLIARQILTRFRAPAPLPPKAPQAGPALLSGREREVLELITKGFTAEEIAELLQVSRHTVLTYVRRIYSKLKVNSKAEAIYEAKQQGILAA